MRQGLVQVYTGEGKGKTTAAIGLIVRALGQGMRVLLVRFLKPESPESGEIRFLKGTPGVEILHSGIGILDPRSNREAICRSVETTLLEAREKTLAGEFDMVVLDEINNAIHKGFLDLRSILSLMEERPREVELVLTGRNAPAEILERADLATRMEKLRHPLDQGIPARRGIEY